MSLPKLKRARNSANATAFAELCFHLHRGAFTKQQLADKTGLVIGTVTSWIKMLKRRKLVYIKFYKQAESHVGQHAAYWAWGHLEPDAEKPKPLTMKEMNARSNIRKKLRREAAKKAELVQKATQLSTSGTLGGISGSPG